MKAQKQTYWQKTNRRKPIVGIPIIASLGTSESTPSLALFRSGWFYTGLFIATALLAGLYQLQQATVQAEASPKECLYLSHLSLSGQFQQQKDGSMRCQSLVRYFGRSNQHSIRYMAFGQQGEMQEMRLSLRLGEKDQPQAIDQLLRFGQSLALPVLGHTIPSEVGQYLRDGHVGHWDFSQASLYIERHRFPVPVQKLSPASETSSREDIELVFRKTYLH